MITQRRVTVLFVVVTLVALGLIGLELSRPRPESTTATAPPGPSATPVSSTVAPASAPTVVDEPFDPDAPIPGCATVEKPNTSSSYSAFTSIGEQSYDNPRFPWFSGPKATVMSQSVVDDLPGDVDVVFAAPSSSFVFDPIVDPGDNAPDIPGTTTASGALTRGAATGTMFVSVQKSDRPVPACVAGELDARRTMPDGTVVDVHDTWTETDGKRRLSRTAHAYARDGSWVTAQADDRRGTATQDVSGQVPLTVDDLVEIVTDDRLRVTTPVPPGTPSPRPDCAPSFGQTDGPAVTREQAARLDEVLAGVDLGGRRLLPLQPSDSSRGTLCTTTTDDEPVAIDVTITGGQALPTAQRPDPMTDAGRRTSTLPDGSVVETRFDAGGSGLTLQGEPTPVESSTTAVVTRPSGTQITVTARAGAGARSPFPESALQAIALTPGLEF